MSEWRAFEMRDLMLEFYDGPHATPGQSEDGPVYLGIKNITADGVLDLREVRHIAESDYAQWTRRVTPQPGDVVFSYEATLHRYALIPEGFRGCLGRRLALIRPNMSIVLPRFLHLLMLGPTWRATVTDRIISGATVDRIPIVEFPGFPIALPRLETQHAAVAILGSLNDLIENNRRRVEILEEMAQLIYRQWFVRFLQPGHSEGALPDSIDQLPSGWAARTSGELMREGVLDIGDGYRAKNAEMADTESGLPFLRVANVRDGYLSLEGCDRLPASYRNQLGSKVSRSGDVAISMKGTVGRLAFVDNSYPPMVYSPQVSFWRTLCPKALSPVYLYQWIRSDNFTQQCAAVKGATDMADYVNLADQRRMKVLLPPAEVMSRFTELAGPMLLAAGRLRSQSGSLALLRDILLPKIVTGRITVSGLCSLPLDASAA